MPIEHKAPIMFNEGLCFLAIGIALLGRELGYRRAVWAGLVPAVIGALTAFEGFSGVDLRIDELFARDALLHRHRPARPGLDHGGRLHRCRRG